MKAAKPSTPAPAAKSNSPFFNKNGGQDFFHSSENDNAFFSENRSPFIQAKLTVGKPNDPYEQEADAIADKVVDRLSGNDGTHTESNRASGEAPATVQTKPLAQRITPFVQTKCASCEAEEEKKLQQKADDAGPERSPVAEDPEEKKIQRQETAVQTCACEDETPVQTCAACDAKEKEEIEIQRKPAFDSEEETVQTCACEEESVQTKSKGDGAQSKGGSSSQIESKLDQSKGAGSPLPSGIRAGMESAFGADFSGVKIHTGSSAEEMNTGLRAHAFAHGNDIYFNSNKYSPETKQGQKLLAHELTHTIQQGSSGSMVGRSSSEDPIQREVDCNAPEESPAPAAAEEASTTSDRAPCTVTNPPGEEPPEGTEEPREEERPASVEANEGAPVGERQATAPAADANAPDREEGVTEEAAGEGTPADPCAAREAAAAGGTPAAAGTGSTAAGGAGGAGAGAGATVGASGRAGSTGAGTAAAAAGGAAAGTAAAGAGAASGGTAAVTAATGAGRGRGEEEPDTGTGFLTAVIARGISPNIVAEGLGEAASPELQASRDEQFSEENSALLDLDTSGEAIQNLTANGTGFMPVMVDASQSRDMREGLQRRHARSGILASEFMKGSGEQLQELISRARESVEALQEQRKANRAQLEADIQARRDETRGAFTSMRGRANARAAATQLLIDARYVQTLVQIEVKATLSTLLLMVSNISAQTNLATAKTNQLTQLDGVYDTAYNNLIAVGNEVGLDAQSRAARHSRAYRNAEGVQDPEVANKVRNRVKDGFWDGYLTYNRYRARAESATEVGNQYKEGMEKEGQKQADNMMCGKHVDVEVVNSIGDTGTRSLQCTYDNANDNIQRQRQVALMQAQATRQELGNAVRSSLQATLMQLREREASNLQLINDYGIRQAMAIERDSATSISSMLKGVNQGVTYLSGILTQFSTEVKAMNAPDPQQLMEQLRGIRAQFGLALAAAGNAMNNANTSSGNILSTGLAHAQSSTQQLSDDGISGGRELAASFISSMTSMSGSANSTFDLLWTNVDQAMQGATDQGTAQINGVVTAITGLYTQMNAGLTARFQESANHLRTGMTDSLNHDFDAKICAEAEKAAAEVQPWWKTVLKVLLVIVVIVVVALVIGPAVIGAVGALATSMAGALGAGVALAGTIGTWVGAIVGGAIVGALSGLTIQVGNNLIDMIGNGPFSWDRATRGWKQAVIAGAIGGALGGLGGQLGQLLAGRLATVGISSGWQLVAEFGVNMAFDTIGGILGDLANGNPITLEGVLQGALIGAVVQVSFVGIGRMARSGEAAIEGGRAATRMQRLAMGIEGIQKGAMGFGERVGGGLGARFGGPSAEWSSRAMAAAREAMAPRRPQSGTTEENNTTPRTTGDENTSTATRPTEDNTTTPRPTEETSTPKATEETVNPVEEITTPRPGEETATPRPGEETTSRPTDETTGTRPDEPTPRPAEESEGMVKAGDLEDGVAAQRDLPDGHKERINENLDPEGCSSCDLLKRRYEEMFRRGQIEMDEAEFGSLIGEFDKLKTDLINQHGDAILETPTSANRGDIINGRTRQEIYDEYQARVTDIERRVLGNTRNRSLIVGEGTFEYTDALMKKLAGTPENPNPGGHDITATGYQSRAEMEAINAKQNIQNPPPAGRVPLGEGPSLSIEHGVDAMNLGSRYPANSFDRVIYNNPEMPGGEAEMRTLLSGVLDSAPTVLRPGGELHIGLTGSPGAKGRLFLDEVVSSGGSRPRAGRPVIIEFNGRRYSVRILPETEFTAPYRGRKTEGSGLRNARQPKRYYVFKPL